MKRIGNIWDEVVSIDNLTKSFNRAKTRKANRRVIRSLQRNLTPYLLAIQDSLINHTFTTSEYRVRTIFEPKKRDIYILPFYPDRIVQHAVLDPLIPFLVKRLYYHSYSCIKEKGQHLGSIYTMECVRKYKYYLQCDISKFYPSINHDILYYDVTEHYIKDPNVLWLLHDIIYSVDGDTNCPIGNYTSQWFGNMYLTEMDFMIKHNLKIPAYLRYCDDFILFSNDKSQLKEARIILKEYLQSKRKLSFSKDIVRPCAQGLDVLGYRHFPNGKILVRKSSIKRLAKKLKICYYNFRNGITSSEYTNSVYSAYNGLLSHAQTYNFRQSIDFDAQYEYVKEVFKSEHQNNIIKEIDNNE